jgi:drug/metabolite transporter (DMT)-like permease
MRYDSNAIAANAKTFSAPDRTRRSEAWLLGTIGMLSFSMTLPATRLALEGLDSTVVGLGRAVVAALFAGILLLARGERAPPRRLWPRIAIVALGCVIGFPLLSAIALKSVGAAHGAVITGLLPMATAIMAVLRGGERPSRAFWAASLLGLIAVLIFAATQGASGIGLADLLILAAVFAAGWGYAEGAVLAKSLGSWQVICWALLLSAPFLAPVVALRIVATGLSASPSAWLGFFYVASVSMFLGFFAWYRAMALAGTAQIGQIQLAQPIATLLWSALFLGESVSAANIIAAFAVMGSVVLTQRARVARGHIRS